ncbi:DUF6388 family protein [Erwinia tracheiphila]|uniref:Uncharacterized protein n=1 Tax=Erwinia tracheiphila TaxID=65700 RepID=A0A345CQ59_9GAMM|nr:DUF6388 family protein [Erwinia tracheiphila]AXF75576.1 hypothetical protein AV903_04895 [Erwinia tracheiphila]UIA81876.1 DUF6388 family protein [Erwinia tracheiphila]UIA90472.1 DUF6388 family protein [Erwinia tracheiphila]
MKTVEEYYAIAKKLFLDTYPEINAAITALSAEDAAPLGMTLAQLQSVQADRAWAAFIREKKLDGMIFAIQLAEPDKAIAAQAIEAYLREHAAALGMSWEAFCIKNEL